MKFKTILFFFLNYGFTLGVKVHSNTFCRLKDHFIQSLTINSVFKRNISVFLYHKKEIKLCLYKKIANFYT